MREVVTHGRCNSPRFNRTFCRTEITSGNTYRAKKCCAAPNKLRTAAAIFPISRMAAFTIDASAAI
jgi:hypothetical protein